MFELIKKVIKGGPLEDALRRSYVGVVPITVRDYMSRRCVNPYSDLEDRNKVIFVHVPKNAGNGVAVSLFGMRPSGHNYLEDYKAKDQNKYNEYFKFGFSRNVYSRFFSAYQYLDRGGFGVYDDEFAELYIRKYDGFNDFVKSLENPKIRRIVMSWTHFIPQVNFFFVDGCCKLDYLGSVEDMDSSLRFLSARLGLPFKGNEKINSSGAEDYRSQYSSRSVDIVSSMYQQDIRFLGCEF